MPIAVTVHPEDNPPSEPLPNKVDDRLRHQIGSVVFQVKTYLIIGTG